MSTADPATLENSVRLGHGLAASERAEVLTRLASLDARLRSWPAGSVDLLLTVKDRDQPGQKVTLEATIAGAERAVSTSTRAGFEAALLEVRDDLIRQLTDAKNRTEPRQNRQRRDTEP